VLAPLVAVARPRTLAPRVARSPGKAPRESERQGKASWFRPFKWPSVNLSARPPLATPGPRLPPCPFHHTPMPRRYPIRARGAVYLDRPTTHTNCCRGQMPTKGSFTAHAGQNGKTVRTGPHQKGRANTCARAGKSTAHCRCVAVVHFLLSRPAERSRDRRRLTAQPALVLRSRSYPYSLLFPDAPSLRLPPPLPQP
jgi:hypothetical protein